MTARFEVAPAVYRPSDDSQMLVDSLGDIAGRLLLDMGTGCGVVGIAAALAGARVVAVDISPAAVECARANARANGVDIEVRRSDLFGSVPERFDVVAFNPPYLPHDPGEPPGPEVVAWDGGPGGAEVVGRFLAGLPAHLNGGGRALVVLSSLTACDLPSRLPGWRHRVVAEKRFPFETLRVHEARVPDSNP